MTNESPAASAGPSRRTIIAGAAWTIPVIAVATASPAMAASATLELVFNQPTYSGVACEEITSVRVTATEAGAPRPGESITVVLADGYTFADGSTTYTAVSGADGAITLPAIAVPAVGGDSVFAATSGAATASAPVESERTGTASIYARGTGTTTAFGSVPPGSTSIGGDAYLAPDGDLYVGNTRIATGVQSAGVPVVNQNGEEFIPFVSSSGVASIYTRGTGVYRTYPNVPLGSTSIGGDAFLAPNGDLWVQNVLVATDVASVGTAAYDGTDQFIPFVSSSGVASIYTRGTGVTSTFPNVPSDATAIGGDVFVTSDGDLWVQNVLIATGVTSTGIPLLTGDEFVPFVSAGGVASLYRRSTGTTTTFPSVPAGSTAIGGDSYLAPNGDLYVRNTRAATGVTSAGVPVYSNDEYVPFVSSPVC